VTLVEQPIQHLDPAIVDQLAANDFTGHLARRRDREAHAALRQIVPFTELAAARGCKEASQ
jgi:hypothetical protein